MRLDGKVGIVTGSTKGIGLAIATALLDAGASVAIGSRTAADVERAVRMLDERGKGRVLGMTCDVRDADACAEFVQRTVDRFGRLDILVNNAGLGRFAPIQELSLEDWQVQIDTNLNGVFYFSKAAIPHLGRDGGWIINIGSLSGKHAIPGGAGYNASKFGLMGLTDAMMLDLRHEGIRVSVIMPGSVDTDFSAPRAPGDAEPGQADDSGAARNAWKLQAEDCARAVMHLLEYPSNALPSRVELRPSRPPRR